MPPGGLSTTAFIVPGPGLVEPQPSQITNVHTTDCIRSSTRGVVVDERRESGRQIDPDRWSRFLALLFLSSSHGRHVSWPAGTPHSLTAGQFHAGPAVSQSTLSGYCRGTTGASSDAGDGTGGRDLVRSTRTAGPSPAAVEATTRRAPGGPAYRSVWQRPIWSMDHRNTPVLVHPPPGAYRPHESGVRHSGQ